MNERMQRILADLKARQEAGEHMACPRCGCDTMKPAIYTNALSRQADIMVCDDCGMSEAKLAFMGNPMPLTQWACFKPRRPDGDFKAATGEEAWGEIQETQLDYLKDVFTAWINGDTQNHFAEQRIDVKERCKGLKEIWEQPFMVTYAVRDGELVLRFRMNDGRIEIAHDVTGKQEVEG